MVARMTVARYRAAAGRGVRFTCGYVTITTLVTPDDPAELTTTGSSSTRSGRRDRLSMLHERAKRVAS
jgi:hypothetical protein